MAQPSASPAERGPRARAALCGVALVLAATASLHLLGDRRGVLFGWATLLHLTASAGWLLVVRAVATGRWLPGWALALGCVVLVRLLALPVAPALSDDFYRYLHEGHLVTQGVNPYVVAPDAAPPELRGAYHHRINNPSIPAAYPAVVQWCLAAAAWLQPAAQQDAAPFPWALKLVFGGCDLLVFVVLWRWLPRLGRRPQLALVHGLCPLVVLEYTVEAHSDSVAILGVVAALWAWSVGRRALSGAALGIATGGKYLPAVLLPFVARRPTAPGPSAPWRGSWVLVAAWAAVLLALYAPFLWDVGGRVSELLRGTGEYVGRWRSNDSAFAGLMAALEALFAVRDGVVTTELGRGLEIQRLAKVPLAILGVGWVGWMAWRRWPAPKAAAGLFVFFLAWAPTVHPWYVGFLVPFLAIYPNSGWLLFCATVYLAYHVLPPFLEAQARGEPDLGAFWRESPWLKAVEYAPLYFGVGWAAWTRRRGGATPAARR